MMYIMRIRYGNLGDQRITCKLKRTPSGTDNWVANQVVHAHEIKFVGKSWRGDEPVDSPSGELDDRKAAMPVLSDLAEILKLMPGSVSLFKSECPTTRHVPGAFMARTSIKILS